ncbi:MAG: type II toxin-antitoxin system RelE/ParE family toxin [Patescibacteria group bacterium]
MDVNFTIVYHELVVTKDIPALDKTWCVKIKRSIESKLETKPEVFGHPLRRSLAGYRKLRVGDYRIVFRIEKKLVKILIIAHRSHVYQIAAKRK